MKPSKPARSTLIALATVVAVVALGGLAGCEPESPAAEYCQELYDCDPVLFSLEYASVEHCSDHLGGLWDLLDQTATTECNDAYDEYWDCHIEENCKRTPDCQAEFDTVELVCDDSI